MKPYHVATLALSCVTIGVLLSLFCQYKLSARGKASKIEAPTVLDPTFFSGGKNTLAPVVSTSEEDQEPVPQPPPVAKDAAPPAGSGERWTPLK